MDRRTVLKAGVATAGTLAMPAYLRAQSNKKLSILTWNIADQEALFKEEFADFQKTNPGVEIEWMHTDDQGDPDLAGSVAAAKAMILAYGIVHEPARWTRHTEGLAIDMHIQWEGDLAIANKIISSLPRNGAQNTELRAVGASYGVIKLASDPPHWSSDGH